MATLSDFWPFLSSFGMLFLLDPGVPGVRSMGSSLSNKLSEGGFADLSDVILADEDTNSILTDNANRAFQRNLAMQ